jgi:signal transduction histidine kinase
MVLASGLLALIVGGAFAVLLAAIDDQEEAAALSRHSQRVLVAANNLERLVIDLETGERGFVLTRDESFLEPWTAAQAALPDATRELEGLALVPRQHARAEKITRAVDSYLRDYSLPVVAATRAGDPSATSVATALDGRRRVDALRAEFDQLRATERDLAAERQDRAEATTRRAIVAVAVGLAGSVLLILFVGGYLARAIVLPVRRAADMAGRVAAGDLSVRMPETGVAEIGSLEGAFNVMASSMERGRNELAALADEQAALRRVATLVARGEPPDTVFTAVAEEVGQLLPADYTLVARYDADATYTGVGGWSRSGDPVGVGRTFDLGGESVAALVLETGRPARRQGYASLSGDAAAEARARGIRSSVGAPIRVEGRVWGVVIVASAHEEPLPRDSEERLADFTALVGTAIANAEAQAELTASRARIVATADETRRRIERDLHDGTQQRLVSFGLGLRAAEAMVPPGADDLREQLARTAQGLAEAVEDLQELSRGIHPAILSKGGLGAAIKALGRRSAVPVELDVHVDRRLPKPVEVAAYYVVSEALTNAAKHAQASLIRVDVDDQDGMVRLAVTDDGVGGADPDQGSGLVGLRDRIEAVGGHIEIASPPGGGTSLVVAMPVQL